LIFRKERKMNFTHTTKNYLPNEVNKIVLKIKNLDNRKCSKN